jgi:hypothetical protein
MPAMMALQLRTHCSNVAGVIVLNLIALMLAPGNEVKAPAWELGQNFLNQIHRPGARAALKPVPLALTKHLYPFYQVI